MSKRHLLCFIVFHIFILLPLSVVADDVFDEHIVLAYEKAISLNDNKNYLEAYRQIVMADQMVEATLQKEGLKAFALSDFEFLYRYWPVKKSRAEIAYLLGIYSDMGNVSKELQYILENKKWDDDDISEFLVNGLWADLAKIDGSRYYLTEQFDSAETALKRALSLKIYENRFICPVHGDLAQLYYKQGRYDLTLTHIDAILANPLYQNDSRERETKENIQEVRSQRAICLARLGRYVEALQEIEPVVRFFKKASNKRLYAEALRKKAKILMLQYDATGQYSPTAKTCYQEYLAISRDFIDSQFVRMSESEREQYWMAEQPFVIDCFRLEDHAPELLFDVALYSKAVLLQMGRDFKSGMTEAQRQKALATIRVNWRQVRDCLPNTGCAIEFIVYEKKGESHIGALVIQKKSVSPEFVDIGRVNDISNYSLSHQYTVKDVFADTQSKDNINALYQDEALRSIVWNNSLVNAIGQSREVYFSPDGIFYQMGIEYMTPPALDNKRLNRLTTTRLLTTQNQKLRTDNMLLCGGVEYSLSEEDAEGGNDVLAYSLLASQNLSVTSLPNSVIEVDSVLAIRHQHVGDRVLRADSVTEAALSQLLGKYHIFHISTHGLFAEVAKIGTDIRPSSSDMQLSRSCLFLSGSERNLKNKGFDASQHDGILSARELAKIDMEQVDLTILSACMSGLGYITPDGVYGLQRGLKSAGVKSIISTLWSVDDEATCYFIIQLYKNLEKGQRLYDAFWAAREALKKYEKTYGNPASSVSGSYTQRRRITVPKYNKPYFYNAFILIDGL